MPTTTKHCTRKAPAPVMGDSAMSSATGPLAEIAAAPRKRGAWHPFAQRAGVTILQMLAVVTILGILAAVVLHRVVSPGETARKNACYVLKGQIELETQLWYRHNGSWPASDLSDIGSDPEYFPEGSPICPVDGSSYTIDSTTHRVIGHVH